MSIPLFDIGYSFAKIFVIGDRHVHRVYLAVAHLAEDFFRPVGILQRVDSVAGFAHD